MKMPPSNVLIPYQKLQSPAPTFTEIIIELGLYQFFGCFSTKIQFRSYSNPYKHHKFYKYYTLVIF